jgi:hypothetical protein
MKTICAWCGSTVSVNCNHCGAPLTVTSYVGSTFDTDAMVCFNGQTPLIYSRQAIEAMPITHGICKNCRALPEETRDALLIERRRENKSLPNAGEQAEIIAAPQNPHEAETRSGVRGILGKNQPPAEQRGPTGVSAAPTVTKGRDRKKRDGHR